MKQPLQDKSPLQEAYSYLALGDSYTIGEKVEARDNFPSQVTALLNEQGIRFNDPEIVAQTGWTTDELEQAIQKTKLRRNYDIVTILIGVNNQYRGRKVEDYIPGFESLLRRAIQLAGNDAKHVIVLSIPDWGVTPFAAGRDRMQIAREINAYNAANKQIALRHGVHYIDITPWTREAATDHNLLAADGLHPSGKEYAKWAHPVSGIIAGILSEK
ncbi:MAG: SGNH/GDSL hydrolase family protein [Bacteroidota bacterium]|nr:SGNH/GDSL hydrolase family protein [Bacteroidota bacterium]